MQPILIYFNKRKVLTFLLIGVLFLIGSCWLFRDAHPNSIFLTDPFIRYLVSVSGIIFSLVIIFFFSRKLFQKKPALIIDEEGIIDYSSALAAGRVYWHEIFTIQETVIQTTAYSKEKIIAIMLCDPQAFMLKFTSAFAKKMMQLNLKSYHSPFHISARSLSISHDDLLQILKEQLALHS